ncbi:DUF6563 family protein [Alistipes ihumii]|uniref:DUF6563 family protein n=1 Tax=Alistipes ihumii TaxID=1470347 RepID=UPI003AB72B2A
MKHLLLLLALLCLAQRSAAQGGKIYRSLDDYRNDRYETVPDLYLKPPVDEAVFGRFGYKLACTDRETKKTLKATTFAVVGDTLYVNLAYLCDTTRENSLQCLPAERIDRYVLFRYFSSYQAAMVGYNWAMFGLVGAAVTYDREREKVPYFILDLQTGKVEQITCEVMTRIIGGYPDLLKSYLSLQEPESRATIDDYLNLYRQRKLRGEPELPIPERPIATAGNTEDSIPSRSDFTIIYMTAEDYLNDRGTIMPDIRLEPIESLRSRDDRSPLLRPIPVVENPKSVAELTAGLKDKVIFIEQNDSLYVNCRRFPARGSGYAPGQRIGDRIFCRLIPGYRAKLPEETIRAGNGTASNELPDGNLPYWFYMDLRTGEVRALDSGCLYGLLEEYPDLYENYMTEPEPNRKETLDGYFDAYLGRAGGRP